MLGSPLPDQSRKKIADLALFSLHVLLLPFSPKIRNAYTDSLTDLISLYILPTNLILFTLSPT